MRLQFMHERSAFTRPELAAAPQRTFDTLAQKMIDYSIAIVVAVGCMFPGIGAAQTPSEQVDLRADCDVCPVMASIPAGVTTVGLNPAEFVQIVDRVGIARSFIENFELRQPYFPAVRVGQRFFLATHEVTIHDFQKFVDNTGYVTLAERDARLCRPELGHWPSMSVAHLTWKSPGFEQSSKHPVVCLGLEDMTAYIEWINRRTKRFYRYPTVAEWNLAVDAHSDQRVFSGAKADSLCGYANLGDAALAASRPAAERVKPIGCNDRWVHTSPVGTFEPNKYGVFDLVGNVSEVVAVESIEQVGGAATERRSPSGTTADASKFQRIGLSWRYAHPVVVPVRLGVPFGRRSVSTAIGFRLAHD